MSTTYAPTDNIAILEWHPVFRTPIATCYIGAYTTLKEAKELGGAKGLLHYQDHETQGTNV